MPNCPHCNGASFEIEAGAVDGLTYKPIFVQCSGCKAPVAVLEFNEVAQQVSELENRVAEYLRLVTQILQKISSRLDQIDASGKT